MKKYNLKFSFNTSLREVPDDSRLMALFVEANKSEVDNIKEPIERVKILGEIGSYSRMLENFDEAEEFLDKAMVLIDEHDLGIKLWVQNGIRLAHLSWGEIPNS